eukprot:3854802-Pyramimonas_sp.AAC.1
MSTERRAMGPHLRPHQQGHQAGARRAWTRSPQCVRGRPWHRPCRPSRSSCSTPAPSDSAPTCWATPSS